MNWSLVQTPLVWFVWLEAWLALPVLQSELPLPGLLSGHYVWSKLCAVVVLPAAISCATVAQDLAGLPAVVTLGVLITALVGDTAYFVHRLPPPTMTPTLERWLAAAFCLVALSVVLKSTRTLTLPALQIGLGVTLLLTFAAGATWALIAASGLFALSMIFTHSKPTTRH